jgi:transcription initiation factor TFIIIB Brf1 subunit/transcription initiation factor TFIIB
MLTSVCDVDDAKCAHCSGRVVDIDEEMVCSSCGSVRPKEVVVADPVGGVTARRAHAVDYTSHSLGSFLGPMEYDRYEATSRGLSGASSTFRYLKTISDYSQVDEAGVYPCAKLIERICEKLSLPPGVVGQAIAVAKGLLAIRKQRTGYTIAAISAFSMISACRICGVSTVGVKEVVAAHRALGHNVRPSTLIKMGFDSPVKASAMRAEEHLGRVAARLSEVLPRLGAPPGYQYRLLHLARRALGMLDSSVRGGHSPCALAATSFYAAEIAISESESRKRLFTQREVAACVNAAEYTVREQFCELFRPRWGGIYEALRPMLSSPTRALSSQSSPSPPQLQAQRA